MQRLGVILAHLTRPYQPSPKPLSGRPAHRPFRGLLDVHSRCGLHTRAVTNIVTVIRRLQTFRRLHACSGCFRLERSPGGPCTHLSGALVSSGNFQHRGLHFCGSCRRRRRDKRVIRDCSKQRQVRRAASVLSLRQRPHQLISGSVIGTVTIIPHSAGEEAGRWDQSGKAAMSQVGARSHTDPGRRRSEAPAFWAIPL